jgi:hypothetical protein
MEGQDVSSPYNGIDKLQRLNKGNKKEDKPTKTKE